MVVNSGKLKIAFFYLNRVSKRIDEMILNLSKNDYDIYVYINSKSGINDVVYSSLLPIKDYDVGTLNSTAAMYEFMKAASINNNTNILYIPDVDDNTALNSDILGDLLLAGLMNKSILESNEITFEIRSKIYTRKPTLIDKMLGRVDSSKFTTNSGKGDIILLKKDIKELCSKMSSEYVSTFRVDTIHTFLSSAVDKFRINIINSRPEKLL